MKQLKFITTLLISLIFVSCSNEKELAQEPELKPLLNDIFDIYRSAEAEKNIIVNNNREASRNEDIESMNKMEQLFIDLRNTTVDSINTILGGEGKGVSIPFDHNEFKDIFTAKSLKVINTNWVTVDEPTLHFVLEIVARKDIPAKPFKFVFMYADRSLSPEQRFYLAADIDTLKAGETGILHSNPKISEITNLAKLLIGKPDDK